MTLLIRRGGDKKGVYREKTNLRNLLHLLRLLLLRAVGATGGAAGHPAGGVQPGPGPRLAGCASELVLCQP